MQKCVSTWKTYRKFQTVNLVMEAMNDFVVLCAIWNILGSIFFSSKILAATESLRAQAGNLVRLKMLPPNATNQCYCMSLESNNLKLPWSEI